MPACESALHRTARIWLAGLILACLIPACLGLAGCGSRSQLGINNSPAARDVLPDSLEGLGLEQRTLPWAEAEPPLDRAALPSIQSLQSSPRAISVTGPGYQTIEPQEYIDAINFADIPDGKLANNNLPPFAWAVYGLDSYPGDSFPTDLKVTMDTTDQEYWVAFADFAEQRWIFNGPFNASAQVELPFAGKSAGLRDYVSADGRSLFMISVQPDQAVVLSGLELGVDGGAGAPSPVLPSADSGELGVVLTWQHSLSWHDADFAGYIVERAPLLSGSYVELNASPSGDMTFYDSTGDLGVTYRYRVATLDTSGNRAYSNTVTGGRFAGNDTPPVLRVKFDKGPFEGTSPVYFDFSESFDPDGTPISEYRVNWPGLAAPFTSPAPGFSVDLPPGCILLQLSVVSNALSTTLNFEVKVRPHWEDTPITVVQPQAGSSMRLDHARLAYLDGGTQIALIGYDSVSAALSVYSGVPGEALSVDRVYCFGEPEEIEKPVLHKGNLIIPVVFNGTLLNFAWTPEGGVTAADTNASCSAVSYNRGSVVSDGSICYAVTSDETAGLHDIVLSRLLENSQTSVSMFGALVAVDSVSAVYNPGANAIDVVYSDTVSTEWFRWSLDSNTLVDSANISPSPSVCVDIELNPATGEPALGYIYNSAVRYREYDGASWTAEETLDNSVTNYAPFDLLFAHGKRYCMMDVDTGYGALYEYDGGPGWVQRNTPPELDPTGYSSSILAGPGADEVLAAGEDNNGGCFLLRLKPADAGDLLENWDPRLVTAYQLRGAGGSDGLHITFLDSTGKPYHYKGANNGTGWTSEDPGFLFATSVDIGSQKDGEVYLSFNNADFGASRRLEFWDPGTEMLVNQANVAAGSPSQAPCIGWSPSESELGWFYFDDVTGNLVSNSINQNLGLSMNTQNIGTDAIWNAAASREDPERILLLRGGANPWDGKFDSNKPGTADVAGVYDMAIVGAPPLDLVTNDEVRGRGFDGAVTLSRFYLGPVFSTYLPSDHYALAQGPFLGSATFDSSPFNEAQVTITDFDNDLQILFRRDPRKTVSVMEAQCLTGVELTSSLGGGKNTIRWSNFGDWESLPVPPVLRNCNRPELLCGSDGEWHIVYLDWETGAIKCLSTD